MSLDSLEEYFAECQRLEHEASSPLTPIKNVSPVRLFHKPSLQSPIGTECAPSQALLTICRNLAEIASPPPRPCRADSYLVELLSALQQRPNRHFVLEKSVWVPTPSLITLLPDLSLYEQCNVKRVLSLACAIRDLDTCSASFHYQIQEENQPSIVIADHNSDAVLKHIIHLVIDDVKRQCLSLQLEYIQEVVGVADVVEQLEEQIDPLVQLFLPLMEASRNQRSKLKAGVKFIDFLYDAAVTAQVGEEKRFQVYAKIYSCCLWPYVDLCLKTVMSATPPSKDLPQLFTESNGKTDSVFAVMECYSRAAVPWTGKSKSLREIEKEILQQLGSDERSTKISGFLSCYFQLCDTTAVLGIFPSSTRDEKEGEVFIPQKRPFPKWIALKMLKPIVNLIYHNYEVEFNNLRTLELSSGKGGESVSSCSLNDAINLIEDVAVMKAWPSLLSQFIVPLVDDTTWFLRRHVPHPKYSASSLVSSLFLEAMTSVHFGQFVSLHVSPPSPNEGSEKGIARTMLDTFAAFRLQFHFPPQLQKIFSLSAVLEVYSEAFSLISMLSFVQHSLQQRWKLLKEAEKESTSARKLVKAESAVNQMLMFVIDTILQHVKHSAHSFFNEFQQKASEVATVPELIDEHQKLLCRLTELAMTSKQNDVVRRSLESVIALAIDPSLEADRQERPLHACQRVQISIRHLLQVMQSRDAVSNEPLFQLLTFNSFFTV